MTLLTAHKVDGRLNILEKFRRAVGYGNNAATTIYEIVCAVIGMMGGGFIFGAVRSRLLACSPLYLNLPSH